MTKRKAAPRKKAAASRKKPGALKKLASKAMKLVKSGRPKTAMKATAAKPPAPAKTAAPPARAAHKPVPPARHRNRGNSGFTLPPGGVIAESDIRRMPESAYMNETQLEFFRQRLLQMRNEVVDREVDVKERLHQRESFADPADRATAEEEHWLDLRLRERESLLLRKIDDALRRIRDREYGYCEVTGEPIGIPRLLARPTATVCVDVKGQNEQIESQFRDR